jgi:hypothetical protein
MTCVGEGFASPLILILKNFVLVILKTSHVNVDLRITSPAPLKKKGRVLYVQSYGMNMYDISRGEKTSHAEANAIANLRPRPRNKKHLHKINILVIRTSCNGKLGMSKPCVKCLIDMNTKPQQRGYIIKDVYYSNNNGDIVNSSLQNLIKDGNYHISRYYRSHNFHFDKLINV